VVDSDETIRRSAHHLLGCQGATVETARDAHEAIALARQTPYSAALVDIRLPDMDGFETYKRLREVQPDVPIILMTGFGWDPSHSIVKARQEGLQTVLYKPFRADRLLAAVEQALHSPAPDERLSGPPPSSPPAPAAGAATAATTPAGPNAVGHSSPPSSETTVHDA
jgi:DNA-binding NtrC family response regulator